MLGVFSVYWNLASHFVWISPVHSEWDRSALLCSAIIYHCDLSGLNPEPKVFREVEVKGIKQEDFQTTQVISPSFLVASLLFRSAVISCRLPTVPFSGNQGVEHINASTDVKALSSCFLHVRGKNSISSSLFRCSTPAKMEPKSPCF